MRKITTTVLIILILTGVYIYFSKNERIGVYFSKGGCNIEVSRGDIVTSKIAQAVAQNHVTANNKPYNWVPIGYYPIYNSHDSINYYAFIFRKSDFTKFNTLTNLEQNANNYPRVSSDEKKYLFSDIASVWTGAADNQKLIMRHYRGIPEIVAEKMRIKGVVENKLKDKTIGNIIADSEAGQIYFDIVDKLNNTSTGEVIGIDYSIVSKKELNDNQEKIEQRRYSGLTDDKCAQLKKAMLERETEFKRQWDDYNSQN